MLDKFLRVFYTISYLKPIQIFYQVWYRIKNKFLKIGWYKKYDGLKIHFLQSNIVNEVIISQDKYKQNKHFKFLNLEHKFNDKIDWNFLEHGKLWNYNLQYFDILQDESITKNERENLLQNFSEALEKGEVKLEPYPVSLRVINSILFISKYNVQNHTINKALKKQINYLENNLEYHLLANHLLENVFTLFISAFAIQNKNLLKKANKLLQKQLKEQILSNGAHFELSPMYHSIILSKLLLCLDVCMHNEFSQNINYSYLQTTASKMLGWINEYSFSDGSWALMNDAALNVAPTTQQLNVASNKLKVKPSKTELGECGFYKLKNEDAEVLITTGKISPSYQPGHAHSHGLHFCMVLKGKQIIVDTGISTYNNTKQRWYERSTVAHNTITVNNQSHSDVWGAFRVGKRSRTKIIQLTHDFFNASIEVREELIKRSFLLENYELTVSDFILSDIEAIGKLHFVETEKLIKEKKNIVFSENFILRIEDQNNELSETFISNQYNQLQKATCLSYKFNKSASIKISWQ